MTIRAIRLFFLILSSICGYYLGGSFLPDAFNPGLIGAVAGLVLGILVVILERYSKAVSPRNLSTAAFGLVFGFLMAKVVILILKLVPLDANVYIASQIFITLVLSYLGMIIALKGKDEFNIVIPYVRFKREDQKSQMYIIDTSVIIDGRIAAICETGFITGRFIIPRFILQELHHISDSPDDSKRNRGRRGLDMLEEIKGKKNIEVIIHEEGLPGIKEVDEKLVRLARILDCPVITNDFNLNKVAKIEGVNVLNLNDLANAMRPMVFPGENMHVHIRKEGKERNQGVAFMDDGTMIVVENAKKLIGKGIQVTVTSVLQTSAGRMIFANPQEKKNENGNRV